MVENNFPLDPYKNSRIFIILQFIMGIACIALAVFWIVFNIRSSLTDIKIWAAVFFLIIFGAYQLMAGLGKTDKYIITAPDMIRIRQYSALPEISVIPDDIDIIEIYPLSVLFYRKNHRKIKFRFGLSYPEIIDPVKQEIILFAEHNNIKVKIIDEDL
jgi:hypothetical protein